MGVEGRIGVGWGGGRRRFRVGEEIVAEIAFGDDATDGEGLGPDAERPQVQREPARRYSLPFEEVATGAVGDGAEGVGELN